jgi:hypothetical protein
MASDAFSDKNALFRKLKAKSENKVCVLFCFVLFFFFFLGLFWLDLNQIWDACNGIAGFEFLFRFCVFVNSDLFRLQCKEPYLGVGDLRDLPLHRLLGRASQPRRSHQLREVSISTVFYFILIL